MLCDNHYDEVKVAVVKCDVELTKNESYGCVKKSSALDDSSSKKNPSKYSSKKAKVVIGLSFTILILLLGGFAASTVYALNEITKLKSQIEFSNSTVDIVTALEAKNSALDTKLADLVSSFNTDHQQLNNSMSAIVNVLLGQISISCDTLPTSLPAGDYNLLSANISAGRQNCPSITTCCGQTGRWRSVANLDMTSSSHQCFSNLTERYYLNKRLCAKSSDSSGCSSVQLSTITAYRSVCGLVRAYQFGQPEAFHPSLSIDSAYVDGVSITYGRPRQHIWSLAVTTNERTSLKGCPCMGGSNSRPAFVGNDYFCDTGTSTSRGSVFYGDDPLWDGAGCGSTNNCCSFNTPPWFHKELPQYTYGNIELRLCRDSSHSDEDIALETVTIYVK